MGSETEYGPLNGNLRINTIEEDGRTKVMIYGDPEGLKSFGEILIAMSQVDQNNFPGLPDGERDHTHIWPDSHLSNDSLETILGRLDAKGTGDLNPPSNFFYTPPSTNRGNFFKDSGSFWLE